MTLKELREKCQLTQHQLAYLAGISLRSYQNYENDSSKINSSKYQSLVLLLNHYLSIDETHGILSIDEIRKISSLILIKYQYVVKVCYLFGSYAKGEAKDDSDVDLFIVTSLSGFDYFGLIEELREALHKKVDLLNQRNAEGNTKFLVDEILVGGIKIYG